MIQAKRLSIPGTHRWKCSRRGWLLRLDSQKPRTVAGSADVLDSPRRRGFPPRGGSLLTSIRTMFVGPIMGKFLDYSHRIYRYT